MPRAIQRISDGRVSYVPSRQVFFSEYATRPSGSIDRRLSAIAGRPAYLEKCSSRLRSPAAPRTAPCNEKPSKSAHNGPFTNGSLRVPPPTRPSRWPARSPDSATPCTAAAFNSSSSCSPTSWPHDTSASLASASSGQFPICRSVAAVQRHHGSSGCGLVAVAARNLYRFLRSFSRDLFDNAAALVRLIRLAADSFNDDWSILERVERLVRRRRRASERRLRSLDNAAAVSSKKSMSSQSRSLSSQSRSLSSQSRLLLLGELTGETIEPGSTTLRMLSAAFVDV